MPRENSVILMVASVAQDNAAAIDIPDDGLLIRCDMFIEGNLNADAERVTCSLEFGAVNSFNTNDSRSLIAYIAARVGMLTSGSAENALSHHFDFGDGLRVFGGERLYLHTAASGGTLATARAVIVFNFATFTARRR